MEDHPSGCAQQATQPWNEDRPILYVMNTSNHFTSTSSEPLTDYLGHSVRKGNRRCVNC